jgi:hypothetical protein
MNIDFAITSFNEIVSMVAKKNVILFFILISQLIEFCLEYCFKIKFTTCCIIIASVQKCSLSDPRRALVTVGFLGKLFILSFCHRELFLFNCLSKFEVKKNSFFAALK